MDRIKSITAKCTCYNCGKNHSFSENINICSVRKFNCEDFTIIFIKFYDNNIFKLKITFFCHACFKVKNIELQIGSYSPQNKFINEDNYFHCCCSSNNIEALAFLSEESIGNNEIRLYDTFTNNDQIINNNQNHNNHIIVNNNRNINNNNNNSIINEINDQTIQDKIDNFNSMNIIEFNKKDKIVNFLDEETNKIYKIYANSEIRVKNLLKDFGDLNPEINYKNKKLMINNSEINPDISIRLCHLNENSIIVIKKNH